MSTRYTLSLRSLRRFNHEGIVNQGIGVMSEIKPVADQKRSIQEDITLPSTYTARKSFEKKEPTEKNKPMHPFDSHPPKVVDFLPLPKERTNKVEADGDPDAYIRVRHHCIAQIRKRQDEILQPFFSIANTLSTSMAESSSSALQRLEQSSHILVDPAYHENVGDHMIVLGEMKLLTRTLKLNQTNDTNAILEQCSYDQGRKFIPRCLDFFLNQSFPNANRQHERFAFWHGGGNWGDLYLQTHTQRMKSISELMVRNYKVLGFPQSYHYQKESNELSDFFEMQKQVMKGLIILQHQKQSNESYEKVQNELDNIESEVNEISKKTKRRKKYTMAITKERNSFVQALQADSPMFQEARSRLFFTWREVSSYEKAKQVYPYITNLLLPDIAFQLGPYERMWDPPTTTSTEKPNNQVDILLFFRTDGESVLSEARDKESFLYDQFERYTTMKNATFRVVDWEDRLNIFSPSSADNDVDVEFAKTDIFFTNTSIQLLSLGKIVICDRLHAAVLCYLTGIPFVFIDQSYGKINKTLSVAMAAGGSQNHPMLSSLPLLANASEKQEHDQMKRQQQGEQNISVNCLDGNSGMWAQAQNLTHALQLAEAFLTKLN